MEMKVTDMTTRPTILFAGGGTGGHLFPSLAIAERLIEQQAADCHIACSDRAIDRQILSVQPVPFTPLSVRPLPRNPMQGPGFLWHYFKSIGESKKLIHKLNARCVVAMGGFVSGPVVAAARKLGVPVLLVNLDAAPGKANRWLSRRCTAVMSVYDDGGTLGPYVERVALPLRRLSLSPGNPKAARQALGLDPDRPTLLITGASQGADSINRMMMGLLDVEAFRQAAADWQFLHLAGPGKSQAMTEAYTQHGLKAVAIDFLKEMGLGWGAADLAISRAGANSVAEAVANGVPTIFFPYPYHKDQHQKLNAQPVVDERGALMLEDLIDEKRNISQVSPFLINLMTEPCQLQNMRTALKRLAEGDGALTLANKVLKLADRG